MDVEMTVEPPSPTPPLPWYGSCQCGQVRITLHQAPLTLYACHCLDCQKQSSSAFGMSMRVRRAALVLEGDVAVRKRDVGKSNEVHGHFCPSCGCRIMHSRPSNGETVNIKAGILDDTSHLQVAGHLWVSRKQPWVQLDPSLPSYDKQPADYCELIERYKSISS
ncbi:MAG: GFA family protein [Pseudomonadota bacterium]